MASKVEIANRALQALGASRIQNITDDNVNARAINTAYDSVRRALLRSHSWNFAVERASIAADATGPAFGKDNYFTLPSDFLYLLDPDEDENFNDRDWQIEGRKIATDYDAPLEIRYVKDVEDPNLMDPLFREALSAKLALELCEELTQSNSKKVDTMEMFKMAMATAKRQNAFERVGQKPMTDTWESVRRS